MAHLKCGRVLLGGLLIAAGVAAGAALGRHRPPPPAPCLVTVHVSGAPGVTVSGEFEADSVPGVPQQARLPAEFSCTGRSVAFTVRHVGGPDRPITAVVDVDGVRRGAGTAAGGVRVSVWGGAEPFIRAASSSDPEWRDVKGDGPPPELVGTRPPEWTPVEWVNAGPLRLADLRGKVVLARWFTGPICGDCVATAPALCEFHDRYADRGLAVVGMHHHSDDTLEAVREVVAGYGFRFPVGIDRGAKTRRLWCLGRDDHNYTSVTFLLDREGSSGTSTRVGGTSRETPPTGSWRRRSSTGWPADPAAGRRPSRHRRAALAAAHVPAV